LTDGCRPEPGGGPGTAGLSERAKSRLELTFTRAKGKTTYLSHQYASYPFHVCRAQYLDREPAGLASLYIQSSAGGLYEGDHLEIAIRSEPGAQAHVTTQASSIVHRSRGPEIRQNVELTVEEGGLLEYLPDPNILFAGAVCSSRLCLSLACGGRAIIAESFIGHDPQGQDRPFERYRSETAVTAADGALLVLDRIDVAGAEALCQRRGVLGANRGQGIMLVASRDEKDAQALLPLLRGAFAGLEGVYAGVSALPSGAGVGARFLAADGDALKKALEIAWAEARRGLTGAYPARRRK